MTERLTAATAFVWEGTVADFEPKSKFKTPATWHQCLRSTLNRGLHIAGYRADIDGAKGGGFYGILYEERGRGILCNRGTKTWIDAKGAKYEQRMADAAEVLKAIKSNDWNEYNIVAKANHLTQVINGTTTAEVIDWQADKRATEGLLAFQIHAGMGEMTVQFKDIQLKKLSGAEEVTPEKMPIPPEAKLIEGPKPKKK